MRLDILQHDVHNELHSVGEGGTVKDPESTRNDLLGKAVTDAIAKATVLSQAANVKLQTISKRLTQSMSHGKSDKTDV